MRRYELRRAMSLACLLLLLIISLAGSTNSDDAAASHPRYHMEVGANLPMKRVLRRRFGVGDGVVAFLFDPQYGRNISWVHECERKAREMGNTTCLPYAAWIRNETLTFRAHSRWNGQYSTLYSGSVVEYMQDMDSDEQKKDNARSFDVQAIDLAEWMKRHIPEEARLTAKIDVEGAEYVLMRHLILRGQACRFSLLEFEGHAMSRAEFVPLRTFDVRLPWSRSIARAAVTPIAARTTTALTVPINTESSFAGFVAMATERVRAATKGKDQPLVWHE